MPRIDRAKQFAPFDALKGLQETLRLKEYEHDKIIKGDLLSDKVEEISQTLLEIKPSDWVRATIFDDGYEKVVEGTCEVDFEKLKLIFEERDIQFDMLRDLVILNSYSG